MSRPKTRAELLTASATNYQRLNDLISQMSANELATPLDFSNQAQKKEAHWSRDKNLRDVLIHLYEWHQLVLNWVTANLAGKKTTFLPDPYNWRTYSDLNVEFWHKHQATSLEEAQKLLEQSHQDILSLAQTFSDQELFTKQAFDWVGGSTLGSYFVSATASHYDWAIKKLRAHQKNLK